ncbi:flavin reductase family protein [Corynebacterium sp. sy039]|uniref:flavin reductase family protein n=1 Tax=Corynebacterium sp. sy039 TaxID=2599641 RepID=UPI0011B598A0|nr:iron-sulfur cluster-binding domain-containing protein [Corynebacterium sp. sy039]QDZ43486.1 iron-sulfur cluster-binding domain-containing protein [Corynebacterium sp. sy039]
MPKDALGKIRGVLTRLTTPLLPDDYSVLANPLWSTRQLRGRIISIEHDKNASDVVHIAIQPGWAVPTTFYAGQYIGVGVAINGRFVWRSYSLTNAPVLSEEEDKSALLYITVRAVEKGQLSQHLVGKTQPGTIIRLLAPAGDFQLSQPPAPKMAFIAAGTGITPIISMLRTLARRGDYAHCDVVIVYSTKNSHEALFATQIQELADTYPSVHAIFHYTQEKPRLHAQDYGTLIPDIAHRTIYACGPAHMLRDLEQWAKQESLCLKTEHFTLDRRSDAQGGVVTFGHRGAITTDGATTILEAGEQAGINMPFGCRMGLCHTCVRPLRKGHVFNVHTGHTHEAGTQIRTCVCVAAGDVTIDV